MRTSKGIGIALAWGSMKLSEQKSLIEAQQTIMESPKDMVSDILSSVAMRPVLGSSMEGGDRRREGYLAVTFGAEFSWVR